MGPCKQRKRVKRDRKYTPTKPRVTTVATLGRAWARYHHPDAKKREGIDNLAERYKIKKNSLLSMFQSIRRAGGWDKYKAAVSDGPTET